MRKRRTGGRVYQVKAGVSHHEPCEWDPPDKGGHRRPTKSRLALRGMQAGDILRIEHFDMTCNLVSCSLSSAIQAEQRLDGKLFTMYHEAFHIAVVKRIT